MLMMRCIAPFLVSLKHKLKFVVLILIVCRLSGIESKQYYSKTTWQSQTVLEVCKFN